MPERFLVTLYHENPGGTGTPFPSIARLLFIYVSVYLRIKQKDAMRTGMRALRSHTCVPNAPHVSRAPAPLESTRHNEAQTPLVSLAAFELNAGRAAHPLWV